jgi:hypothetical protein
MIFPSALPGALRRGIFGAFLLLLSGTAYAVPPTAVDDGPGPAALEIAEGGSINGSYNVLANDTNPEVTPMTAQIASNPSNASSFTLFGDGTFNYTHDGGETTSDSFTYQANNGELSNVATVTITINPVNDPPQVVAPTGDRSYTQGDNVNLSAGNAFDDAENDNLSFSASGLPASLSINTNNGNITGQVTNDDWVNGPEYNVTVTADDGNGGQTPDNFTITINNVNDAPEVTAPTGNQTFAQGDSVNLDAGAAFTDPDGDALGFTATGLPASLSVNTNTGAITGTPTNADVTNGPVYGVTVTANDGNGGSVDDSFNITISNTNDAPQVTAPTGPQSFAQNEIVNLNAGVAFTDPDGDSMTFSATGLPASLVINTSTGLIAGTITNDDWLNGPVYNASVTADDGNGGQATDNFNITITNVNDPPTVTAPTGNQNYSEGDAVNLDAAAAFTDIDGDTLTYSAAGLPASLAINPNTGAITGTLTNDDVVNGPDYPVTVTADDGNGGTADDLFTISIADVNEPPEIVSQNPVLMDEDTSREIVLADLNEVTDPDPDDVFPTGFTLTVQPSVNYTNVGNTITPPPDFSSDVNGDLIVIVTVNDGIDDSAPFNLVVTVNPINDVPVFGGVQPPGLTTPEDTTLTILVENLIILDPDNVFPTDFTLTLTPVVDPETANYTLAGETAITPAPNFNGDLFVAATVSDLEAESVPFLIPVTVDPINDLPVLVAPIGPQQAIEDSPFLLDITPNFSDDDPGDELSFSVEWPGGKPPNIDFDPLTGTFSGTPTIVDTEVPGPTYTVVVTAADLAGEIVSDTFDLTINALGRANLGLMVDVSPATGLPGDQLLWTFTATNPVGPVAGENVELSGSFIGLGITVTAEGGANCTITLQAASNRANFVCALGGLPVGNTLPIRFTTATSQPTEVIAFATVQGALPVPIDPNLDDNSAVRAVGVAESVSLGAVQNLGTASVRSVAAGDVNGDGALDLVVGTGAGQPVQVYFGDALREACQCQRDFLTAPISVPDAGANEGIALADFDGNGALDIAIANGAGQPDTVYGNDGAGNFTLMATLDPSNGNDVAVGDFNNDGNWDIAVAAASPNPVYLGDGSGGFTLHAVLGDADSYGVAVGRMDANNRDDLVFANVGSGSRVWIKNAGAGFTPLAPLPIGDAVAVAAGDLNADGLSDVVFGRVPTNVGDIPANPVLLNPGTGAFGAPSSQLGISPTRDVMIGDTNEDGLPDLVFVNASGVHQIWVANGGGFSLHPEQIIDIGAVSGVIASLGDTDNGDPGGVDLAIGGADFAGVGVYLNDSAGNLGRGDPVPPVITLLGEAAVSVSANTRYTDAGATATDNIDGDVTVVVTNTVNTSVVGNYTVTYNAVDFAGNAAATVVRNVTVTPASGSGGGGGGTLSIGLLVILFCFSLLRLYQGRLSVARQSRPIGLREDKN